MKQDLTTIMSGTSLLLSLLCLVGVLHVELRLYEQIQKSEKPTSVVKDSKSKESPTVELSWEDIKTNNEPRELLDNKLVSAEKSGDFKYYEKSLNNDKQQEPLQRTRRDVVKSLLPINLSNIRRIIRLELKHIFKSTICMRDKRMCLRGPKGARGPPGTSGPVGLGKNSEPKINVNSSSVLTIIQPPKRLVVNQSDTAIFTCVMTGSPTPKVTWSRPNASLPVNRHVVHCNGSLSIKQVTFEDSDRYVCTATNAHGKAQAYADLIVQVPPRLTQKPKSLSVKKGHDLYLTCAAFGPPTPTISWSKSKGILPERSTTPIPGNLRIPDVGNDDIGTYICTAENLLGRVTAHAQVTIGGPLIFTIKPPSRLEQVLGKPMVLDCQATGSAEVTWIKNNTLVGRPATVYPNGTLVIPNFTLKDAGVYVCFADLFRQEIRTETLVQITMPKIPNEFKNALPKSCSELKAVLRNTNSGDYLIDPDGQSGQPAFNVYCNMEDKGGVGVTVISHDSVGRTPVLGVSMRPGSYRRDVTYKPSNDQLAALTSVSSDCEQYTEFECKGDVMFITAGYAWWVSRDQVRQDYWGGATPGSKKCACGMTNSCQGEPGGCNCNNKLLGTRSDHGLLTDKSTLPVTQLRFGDTDDYNERGYYTLGELNCYGQA